MGSTLEGLSVNPIAYDLLLEQPWHATAAVDLKQWVADYATRRAGRADAAVLHAWEILAEKVLLDQAVGYQFDLVNLTRQALSNLAAIVQARMVVAAEAKDLTGESRTAFEDRWLAITPRGDAWELANRLLTKYRTELAP